MTGRESDLVTLAQACELDGRPQLAALLRRIDADEAALASVLREQRDRIASAVAELDAISARMTRSGREATFGLQVYEATRRLAGDDAEDAATLRATLADLLAAAEKAMRSIDATEQTGLGVEHLRAAIAAARKVQP